jgi:uncharacterized membrane-anchored protein YhcB (DUF1043 family)
MELLIGIGFIFFLVVGLVIWRLKIVQARQERCVNSAYTRANYTKFSGYWVWPKSPEI